MASIILTPFGREIEIETLSVSALIVLVVKTAQQAEPFEADLCEKVCVELDRRFEALQPKPEPGYRFIIEREDGL
jgi:hypothetical protein